MSLKYIRLNSIIYWDQSFWQTILRQSCFPFIFQSIDNCLWCLLKHLGQSVNPKLWGQKLSVIRNRDFIKKLFWPLIICTATSSTKAFTSGVFTLENLIPNLEKKSTMVRWVHGRFCMMTMMLKRKMQYFRLIILSLQNTVVSKFKLKNLTII